MKERASRSRHACQLKKRKFDWLGLLRAGDKICKIGGEVMNSSGR